MANTILIKRSGTANSIPLAANVALGELAINYADGNLFYKDAGGTVRVLTSTQFVSVAGNVTGGNINTGGAVSATGNVTGGNLNAAGLSLSSNVISAINSTSNITTTANISGGNLIGTVVGNVTGTTVSVTGNVTGGNVNAAGLSLSSNVISVLNSTSNITTTGNIAGNYFIGNGSQLTGITVAAGAAITNGTSNVVVSASSNITANVAGTAIATFASTGEYVTGVVSATGNITGDYILGNGSQLTGVITSVANINNGTSNVTVVSSGGNVTVGVGGTSNVAVFATTGEYITGLLSASGNITGANIDTAGLVSAGGNVTGANLVTGGLATVTGNITGGNVLTAGAISAASVSASGNVTGGNVLTGGLISATANVTGGNLITSAAVSAASVSASGNIAGGNLNAAGLSLSGNVVSALNLSSGLTAATTVVAIGNITGGNLITAAGVSAVSVSASGNVTGGNVNTNTLVGTATTIKSTGALNLSATGNIVVNSTYINGVLTPVQDSDAANKGYVDSVAQGLDTKASVHAATYVALPAYTYNNGTSGVGATLTGTATGTLTVDGDVVLAGQRILVKNETGAFVNNTTMSAAFNGIYVCTTEGAIGVAYVLTRSTDFDLPAEMYSAFTFVETGTNQADSGWVCTNNIANPITVGTTEITWTQFSGAGSYTANTAAGLVLNGSVFNAKVDNTTTAFDGTGNIIVKASANLTTPNIGAATGTSLSVTGNITGGNLNAAGLSLSSNVVSAINSTSAITTTANITGGNISATNHTGTTVSVTGNITGGNILGTSTVYSGGVQVLTINDTVDGGTY